MTSGTPCASRQLSPGTIHALRELPQLHLDHARGDLLCAGRALRIGRFLPALTAADHAAHDHRRFAGVEPVAHLALERLGKLTLLHREDTELRAALFR